MLFRSNFGRGFFARQPTAKRIEFGDGFDPSQQSPSATSRGGEPQRRSPQKRKRPAFVPDDTGEEVEDEDADADADGALDLDRRTSTQTGKVPVVEKERQRSPRHKRKRARLTRDDAETDGDDDFFETDQRTVDISARREKAPVAKKVRIDDGASAPPRQRPTTRNGDHDYVQTQREDSIPGADIPEGTGEIGRASCRERVF